MMRPSTAASISLLLVVVAGCDHSALFTFQIVDAKSGKGLENVKLEAPLTGHYLGISAFSADDDPKAKLAARSDAQGFMTLNLKVEKDLQYYVFFTKPGYQAITGQINPFTGHSELKRRASDKLPSLTGISHDLPEIHVAADRTTIIPMQPLAN